MLSSSGPFSRRSSRRSHGNFSWMWSNLPLRPRACEPVLSSTIPKHSFKTLARSSRASALARTVSHRVKENNHVSSIGIHGSGKRSQVSSYLHTSEALRHVSGSLPSTAPQFSFRKVRSQSVFKAATKNHPAGHRDTATTAEWSAPALINLRLKVAHRCLAPHRFAPITCIQRVSGTGRKGVEILRPLDGG